MRILQQVGLSACIDFPSRRLPEAHVDGIYTMYWQSKTLTVDLY